MNCLFFWFCHHFYFTGVRFAILTSWLGPTFTFFKKICFSVEKVLTKRDGADLSRTSKNDERTDDLTRLKDNITDDPTISSNMNKRTDDIANSWKKNKRTCYGGGKKLNSLVSGLLIFPLFFSSFLWKLSLNIPCFFS